MRSLRLRPRGSWLLVLLLSGCASAPGDHAALDPALSPSAAVSAAPGDLFSGRGESHGAISGHDMLWDRSLPQASNTPPDHSLSDASPLTSSVPDVSDFHQEGPASWYGNRFFGHRTASGERYDMHALTAAHRTLPMASYVRVTNPDSGKSVVVRINDRGPFHGKRIIDLSLAAAKALDLQHSGTGRVEIQGLSSNEAQAVRTSTLASGK